MTKECNKCKEIKVIEEFDLRTDNGNYRHGCKECCKKQKKEYRLNNEEKISTQQKEYRLNNKEKISTQQKEYYQENKETNKEKIKEDNLKRKEYRKEYYKNNLDEIKENRKEYYQNNKENFQKYNHENKENRNEIRRKRRKSDPLFKLEGTCRSRTYKAFKSKGWKKTSATHELLGADWETVKNHIEKQFYKGMTWDNQSKWQIDHITPLSSAKTKEEMKELFHWTNLQPLLTTDNQKKSASIPLVCRF